MADELLSRRVDLARFHGSISPLQHEDDRLKHRAHPRLEHSGEARDSWQLPPVVAL